MARDQPGNAAADTLLLNQTCALPGLPSPRSPDDSVVPRLCASLLLQFVTNGARDMSSWRRLGDFDNAEAETTEPATVHNAPASAKLFKQSSAPGAYSRARLMSDSTDDGDDDNGGGGSGGGTVPSPPPLARAISVPSPAKGLLRERTAGPASVPAEVRRLLINAAHNRPELMVRARACACARE